MGGGREPHLPGHGAELGVSQGHGYAAAVQSLLPQPHGHAIGQHRQTTLYLLPAGEVFGEGGAVSHGFHRLLLARRADGAAVQPVGVLMELKPQLAQQRLQHLGGAGRQLTDGLHTVLVQHPSGGPAHEQQVPHRQGPDDILPVFPADDGGGIGLFIVTAQLGEHLVEGHAHRDGQPQLLPQPPTQSIGNGLGVAAEEVHTAGDVQPALVDAEGLYQIGILLIDGVDPPGVLPVQAVVGRQQYQTGTLLFGLPDGLRRLDAQPLGRLVLGQNDAVAGGGVAADSGGDVPQIGVAQQLHRGKKAVQVTVQDHPITHAAHLLEVNHMFYYTTACAAAQEKNAVP